MAAVMYTRARTHSPTANDRSTIGVTRLNYCVRDGNRCGPRTIRTRERVQRLQAVFFSSLHAPCFEQDAGCRPLYATARTSQALQYLEAARPISITRLHPLRGFHL